MKYIKTNIPWRQPKNTYMSFVHGKREFERWVSEVPAQVRYFVESIYREHDVLLDFSINSLSELEKVVLSKYIDIASLRDRYETVWFDDAGKYVGEVFKNHLGGTWKVNYKSKGNFYYKLPVLAFDNDADLYPRSLVTASIDRRTRKYIVGVFNNCLKYSEYQIDKSTFDLDVYYNSAHEKYLCNTLLQTKREYEFWIFDFGFILDYFLLTFERPIRDKLDFSLESLDVLEALLLERYPNADCANDRYQMLWLEDAARYVGKVTWKNIGGLWYVEMAKKDSPDFQLPVIKIEDKMINPKTLVIDALRERTGNYISSTILTNSNN